MIAQNTIRYFQNNIEHKLTTHIYTHIYHKLLSPTIYQKVVILAQLPEFDRQYPLKILTKNCPTN